MYNLLNDTISGDFITQSTLNPRINTTNNLLKIFLDHLKKVLNEDNIPSIETSIEFVTNLIYDMSNG